MKAIAGVQDPLKNLEIEARCLLRKVLSKTEALRGGLE